ncbi:MAG: S1 RNA-binding domain-containing protein [Candidatus Sumerlaeia bacterium]|nr:S1 RNA-binding domain-containing protein [Candidatus Sumerlaeia bacterium]
MSEKEQQPEELQEMLEEFPAEEIPSTPAIEENVDDDAAMEQEFARLLEDHLPGNTRPKRGQIMEGIVAAILEDTVLINYGAKEEAAVEKVEFLNPKGECLVRPGDQVPLAVTGYDDEGLPELSYRQARAVQSQQMIADAFEKGLPIRGIVSQEVHGGLLVDVGMGAFLPGSQVDVFRVPDLSTMIGQEIEAVILDYDERRNRVVLSRRQLLEKRRESSKQEFLQNTSAGAVLTGTVRDVLDFGVFVSLGDVEGLIPRSELSWDFDVKPSDLFKAGDSVEVVVVDVSADTGRLTLSRKRVGRDPWMDAADRYPVGSTIRGEVARVQPFGAFVNLEEGITGLIHTSNMSWDSSEKDVEKFCKVGDQVTCQVLEVDTEKKRIGLGLKQLSRDPWVDIRERFKEGTKHKGTVSQLLAFGALVKLDEGVDGLLHVSELSWEKRIENPADVLKVGDSLDVMVIRLEDDRRRIGLSLRRTIESPFDQFCAAHPVGSVAKGRLTRIVPCGDFVEFAPGLEGLVHISELDTVRVDSPERVVRVDEEISVKILGVEKPKQKISLSRRGAIKAAEEENIRQYKESASKEKVGSSLGDLLAAAMKDKKKK